MSAVASVHLAQAQAAAAALRLAQFQANTRPLDPPRFIRSADPAVGAAQSQLAVSMARVVADKAGLSFVV